MHPEKAYKIMGLTPDADVETLKKKYRELMHQVHPDVGNKEVSEEAAYQLNEAYEVLLKHCGNGKGTDSGNKNSSKKKNPNKPADLWNAPVNANAYCDRAVFQYMEDEEGNHIGEMKVAYGKYVWTEDEDFALFLKSVYLCGKELLDEIDGERKTARSQADRTPDRPKKTYDAARRMKYQAELTYHLAGQFIGGVSLLEKLGNATEEKNTYHIKAMLESGGNYIFQKKGIPAGFTLQPAGIAKHRLFLKYANGEDAGYMSFRDDRLYYALIPLMEQRLVQVKIKTKGVQNDLDVWVRYLAEKVGTAPDSVNLKIQKILDSYRE